MMMRFVINRWSVYGFAGLLMALSVGLLAACSGSSGATPRQLPPSGGGAAPQPSPTPLQTQPAQPPAAVPSQAASTQAAASPTTPQATSLPASGLPDPAGYTWQPVASGLDFPVDLANAGDGSGRLFVVEKKGVIRFILNGNLASTPFLDIQDRVGSRGSEQGLLGLAFHPQYAQNGYFFINYTDLKGNTVIARYRVSTDDPNRADPRSEGRLIYIPQPYPNHNGGAMAFGPDGYLYLGLGDGGSEGDPLGNGQSLNTLLGKILRVDINSIENIAIPPDNPLQNTKVPEVWAYGLRNPWRFSFDRKTGDLYIGDVGQNLWEEIDFVAAGSKGGQNFGWNYFEGLHPYGSQTPPAQAEFVAPVAEYGHDQGCAVTGGVVYRGQALPAWEGVYLFGDYCSGNIWGLRYNSQGKWEQSLLFQNVARITSFGEDEHGEVYLADQAGTIDVLTKK
ncbi:MAG TPA: PQQ-dependent sugar dehydrogenase [Anaerolineales bacterium]